MQHGIGPRLQIDGVLRNHRVVLKIDDGEEEADHGQARGQEVEVAPPIEDRMILFLLIKYFLALLLGQLLADFSRTQQRHTLALVKQFEVLQLTSFKKLGHALIMLLLSDALVNAGLPGNIRPIRVNLSPMLEPALLRLHILQHYLSVAEVLVGAGATALIHITSHYSIIIFVAIK